MIRVWYLARVAVKARDVEDGLYGIAADKTLF